MVRMTEVSPGVGPWFVYVLRCRGDRLYCGIAKDVEERFKAHRAGRGARFTRAFPPAELVASLEVEDRSMALKAEAAFKRLDRAGKLARIESWSAGITQLLSRPTSASA